MFSLFPWSSYFASAVLNETYRTRSDHLKRLHVHKSQKNVAETEREHKRRRTNDTLFVPSVPVLTHTSALCIRFIFRRLLFATRKWTSLCMRALSQAAPSTTTTNEVPPSITLNNAEEQAMLWKRDRKIAIRFHIDEVLYFIKIIILFLQVFAERGLSNHLSVCEFDSVLLEYAHVYKRRVQQNWFQHSVEWCFFTRFVWILKIFIFFEISGHCLSIFFVHDLCLP